MIIGAIKGKYPLPLLLSRLQLARSSYFDQLKIVGNPKENKVLTGRIITLFQKNSGRYGYRRIDTLLVREGNRVSEKVVRRIMAKEGLEVPVRRKGKYHSYAGEITPEVPNIIKRDFHADAPNQKWRTDITEFAIPAGKIYLSPIVDCFDGLLPALKIGTAPDAELVNGMLKDAGLIRSMSKKGCSPDNAACEGLFGRLKMKCSTIVAGLM